KSAQLPGLQHDRQGQDLPDPPDPQQPLVARLQLDPSLDLLLDPLDLLLQGLLHPQAGLDRHHPFRLLIPSLHFWTAQLLNVRSRDLVSRVVKRQYVCKQLTIERRDENSNGTP